MAEEVIRMENAAGDSVYADSVVSDSVSSEARWGIVLVEDASAPSVQSRSSVSSAYSSGFSWIVAAMTCLFLVIALRYRSNTRYIRALLRDMTGVRERGNVFDETVRETSFLILLNLLWVVSSGVLLAPYAGSDSPTGAGACAVVSAIYTAAMSAAYYCFGNVFSDRRHASMWARGFLSGQGLGALVLFPLSIAQICYPGQGEIWAAIALGVLILVKCIFIWKGFRIFLTQSTSLLLFLYYLCSLEIVPLILAYLSARFICVSLL